MDSVCIWMGCGVLGDHTYSNQSIITTAWIDPLIMAYADYLNTDPLFIVSSGLLLHVIFGMMIAPAIKLVSKCCRRSTTKVYSNCGIQCSVALNSNSVQVSSDALNVGTQCRFMATRVVERCATCREATQRSLDYSKLPLPSWRIRRSLSKQQLSKSKLSILRRYASRRKHCTETAKKPQSTKEKSQITKTVPPLSTKKSTTVSSANSSRKSSLKTIHSDDIPVRDMKKSANKPEINVSTRTGMKGIDKQGGLTKGTVMHVTDVDADIPVRDSAQGNYDPALDNLRKLADRIADRATHNLQSRHDTHSKFTDHQVPPKKDSLASRNDFVHAHHLKEPLVVSSPYCSSTPQTSSMSSLASQNKSFYSALSPSQASFMPFHSGSDELLNFSKSVSQISVFSGISSVAAERPLESESRHRGIRLLPQMRTSSDGYKYPDFSFYFVEDAEDCNNWIYQNIMNRTSQSETEMKRFRFDAVGVHSMYDSTGIQLLALAIPQRCLLARLGAMHEFPFNLEDVLQSSELIKVGTDMEVMAEALYRFGALQSSDLTNNAMVDILKFGKDVEEDFKSTDSLSRLSRLSESVLGESISCDYLRAECDQLGTISVKGQRCACLQALISVNLYKLLRCQHRHQPRLLRRYIELNDTISDDKYLGECGLRAASSPWHTSSFSATHESEQRARKRMETRIRDKVECLRKVINSRTWRVLDWRMIETSAEIVLEQTSVDSCSANQLQRLLRQDLGVEWRQWSEDLRASLQKQSLVQLRLTALGRPMSTDSSRSYLSALKQWNESS